MRKLSSFFATALLFVVLCCSVAFCDSRYEFFAEDNYNNKFYLDTQSISINYNIVKFWTKQVYSRNGINNFISRIQDKKRKKLLQKISHALNYIEINLLENKFRIPESINYNKSGDTFKVEYRNVRRSYNEVNNQS